MSHSFTNLLYHIVWSTKHREPWLDDEVRPRVWAYLAKAVNNEGMALMVNGMPDHVHMLVKLHQDHKISGFLRDLKANSSGWIHRTFPHLKQFAWQVGYGAFTVSASQVEKVRLYIANQETHHKKMTYQEEFRALLEANGLDYDERHLWD